MKKVLNIIKKFDYYIQYILFFLMIIGVTLQIFYRYIPGLRISWANEFVSFAFGAMIWLGISVAIEEDTHIGIDFFVRKMNNTRQKIFKIIQLVIFFLFILLVSVLGFEALRYYFNKNLLTPAMRAPYFLLRSPLVIGCIYSLFRIIKKIKLVIYEGDLK